MTTQEPAVPSGAKLSDWDDVDGHRQAIFDSVKSAVQGQFPQSHAGVRLELHDLHYVDPERYSLAEQKDALLSNRYLHRRLRGTYRLMDANTGVQLDEKQATVMKVPWLTDRQTFIHGGSEYTTIHQARLLPGVYTRRKASGEMESHFNVKRGTGNSFRVSLEPDTGLFKVNVGQASLRLYSLLKDLGVSDADLEKRWGPDLLERNRKAYDPRVFDKAYAKFVRRADPDATREQKAAAIRASLEGAKLDHEVVSRTLPNLLSAKAAFAGPAPDEKDEMSKPDLVMLAKVLDDKFHAGIPLDASTPALVQHIMEALQSIEPGLNPDVIAMMVDQHQKMAGVGKFGCLMACLELHDARQIVEWAQEQIKPDDLFGQGIEHEPHVTVKYGFKEGFDCAKLAPILEGMKSIAFQLGKVARFKDVEGKTCDCLMVEVESSDLASLNEQISATFKDELKPSNFAYKPHMTLAYVRKGACKRLEGHARFDGHTYVLKSVTYSESGSEVKFELELGKREESGKVVA